MRHIEWTSRITTDSVIACSALCIGLLFSSTVASNNAYAQVAIPHDGLITTLAGNAVAGYSGDSGLATSAELNAPEGIAVDSAGNIYIADASNNVIRKVSASTGIITTVAGNGSAGYSGDGGAATSAELNGPGGVALDSAGNIYIADQGNCAIREVIASTGIITTVAGIPDDPWGGYSGDGGPATSAELSFPFSLSLDASGNIYIADQYNNVIRKVTVSTGIITTVAGTGAAGYSGDGGQATSAELNGPTDVRIDSAGNIFIADCSNQVVREVVASTGVITTVAGNGVLGYSGDGGPASSATFSFPIFLAFDSAGNLYISDVGNGLVRKVSAPDGIVSTIAGNGYSGYSGDGGLATGAVLNGPLGLAVLPATGFYSTNNIYVADSGNNVIRGIGGYRTAAPVFSPISATYATAQTVTVSDSLSGATIYYTTDGTVPTPLSKVYSAPILVSSTQTLNAIAVTSTGLLSAVGTAPYTITQVAPTVNFASGFTTEDLSLVDATIVSGALQLSDGNLNEQRAAWFTTPVSAQMFTSDFDYLATSPVADGIIFTLQNDPTGIDALGDDGDGLGYQGIQSSVAIKFDMYNNFGEGTDSTGFYINGALPTLPALDMTASGVLLRAGDLMHVHISYDGTTLTWTVSDSVTKSTFTSSTIVDIPSIVGENTAYVGITGSTGTFASTQNISGWTLISGSATTYAATPTFSPIPGTYSTAQSVTISDSTPGATIYYTTDGTTPTTSSAIYSQPISVNSNEIVEAIATAAGDSQSSTGTAAYTINKTAPTITWTAPSAITYGTALSASQLDATANVAGTFAYSPTLATVLATGTHVLSVTFTPTDASDYNSANSTVSLQVNQATPSVSWTSPAPISYGTLLSTTQLNATSNVPGTFTYSPIAGTIPSVGTDTLSVTFVPADGNDYISVTQTVSLVVQPHSFNIPTSGFISTLVGNGTQGYLGDGGEALSSELNRPAGVAVDSAGNLYLADTQNNVIRKVIASTGSIATVAGNGSPGYSGDGGPATSAQLFAPNGVAVDATGNIYIADTSNNTIREVSASTGYITTVAGNGNAGYTGDGGVATMALLNTPTCVALNPTGDIYIADAQNNVIRKVSRANGLISTVAGNTIAGNSGDDGPAINAELAFPTSVAVDVVGNIYIADTINERVRKVIASTGVITAFAGHGKLGSAGDGGIAINAEFLNPTGLSIDLSGNVYITDIGNGVIREVTNSTQIITTVAGNGTWGYSGDGGLATNAQLGLDQGAGVTVDTVGNIYIADPDNNVIRAVGAVKQTPLVTVAASPNPVLSPNVNTTLTANVSSGTGTVTFSNNEGWVSSALPLSGGAVSLSLNSAGWTAGIYTMSAIYSGDVLNNAAMGTTTLAVNSPDKVTPTITWPSPSPITFGTALSGTQLNATASVPGTFVYTPASGSRPQTGTNTLSVMFLPSDVSDYNAAVANVALTVNPGSQGTQGAGIISTIAGNGISGDSGNGGPATSAELTTYQSGIATDALANIYFTDWQNNVVRKVTAATGIITTVAGNGSQGSTGDNGPATSAELNGPAGVSVDALGNVYIADTGNNVIRAVSSATGIITTVAGNYTIGYSGDGGLATSGALYFPYGISVAANGDLYIADTGNGVIRKVTASTGIISTVAGNGTSGNSGDGSSATTAALNGPTGVTVDPYGNLYIADFGNNSIRTVYISGSVPGLATPVSGDIYTLVGNGSSLASNVTLNGSQGVTVDVCGNIYIADSQDNLIRVVYSSGTIPGISNPELGSIYTLAGNGTAGYFGDGGLAANAEVNGPIGVAVDSIGHVYIADTNNQVIREVGAAAKSSPSITWPAPTAITYGTALSGSQLNATASVPGSFIFEPSVGTILSAGIHSLAVTFTPTDTADYASAVITTTITVTQAIPAITWATPASITPGTALTATQLNATASVSGTLVYNPALGSVPSAGIDTLTVSFSPTDTVDYASTSSSVSLTVQQLTPVITWPNPSPIVFGTPLSATELNATASVPGTFVYSTSVGTVMPSGTSTLTVVFTPTDTTAYTSATATVSLLVNAANPTSLLQLRIDATPITVTLSNPVDLDWILWGADGVSTTPTRMAGSSLISNVTPLNGATITADSLGAIGYSWASGTPMATGASVGAEMTTSGSNTGFQITVPADPTVKTLLLYVQINANAQLTASLSDGSVATITHSPSSVQDSGNEIYSIDYRAGSAGQLLTVQLVSTDSSAPIGLQAAVLEPHLPQVSILSPLSGQALTGPSAIPVTISASQYDSTIASVQLLVNGNTAASMSAEPFTTTWAASPGHYSLLAQATDANGLSNSSTPQAIDVIGTGGNLSATFGFPSSSVNLSVEGTGDWTTFAPTTEDGTQSTRKEGVTPLISNYTVIGPATVQYNLSTGRHAELGFMFEDGYPDPEESSVLPYAGISGNGNNGFQLTVPAETTSTTLRLYVDGACVNGPATYNNIQMTAFLSDGSAPVVTYSPNITQSQSEIAYFAITFNAATVGQTLTVQLMNQSSGCIGLSAATLSGTSIAATPNVIAITPNSGIPGSVLTISGTGFGPVQGTSTVTLGGVPVILKSWSGEQISAVIPAGVHTGPVQVVTGVGASNTNVVFTLSPTVTSLSPSMGPVGTVVTITGSGFGTNVGTITFNGITAAPSSWSETQIVVPVPVGSTTGVVVVTQGAPAQAMPIFAVTSGTQDSPSVLLQLRTDVPSNTVNLSDTVNEDWIVWGTDGISGTYTRKDGANLINTNPGLDSWTTNERQSTTVQYSWTGGAPVASGNGANAGVFVYYGPQITVPSDTFVRTLKLYSAANNNNPDQITASLSDGGTSTISCSPTTNTVGGPCVYVIDYRSASAGQTLTIELSFIDLEALVLQQHLPQVNIISPLDGQVFPAQASIPIGVTATQFDTSLAGVQVSANGNTLLNLQPPAYASAWTPQPGHYYLQAQATDTAGLLNGSKPVQIDVIGSGGSLSASEALPSSLGSVMSLTAEGTADWIMAGVTQLCNPGLTRKNGVMPLISAPVSAPTWTGDPAVNYADTPFGSDPSLSSVRFSFDDGDPDPSESSIACSLYTGEGLSGAGFQLSVAADTVPRTLRLYVGLSADMGTLKAFLSDGSAPIVNSAVVSGTTNAVYSITFSAASAGQTLTVQWSESIANLGEEFGQVSLYAATLDGPPEAPTSPVITGLSPNTAVVGTPVAIMGSGFGPSQGTSTVTLNGTTIVPTSWSATEIQMQVAPGSTTGNVVVTVSGVASNPMLLNMPPIVTGTPSSSGDVDSLMIISGANFGTSQLIGGVYSGVYFLPDPSIPYWQGSSAGISSWSTTQIQVTLPYVFASPGQSSPCVVVVVAQVQSNCFSFSVVAPATPTITWATPAAISYGTLLSTTQLNATASIPGTFVYRPAAGTLLSAGSQPLSVTFTPTDAVNYVTATAQVNLSVSKIIPAITWTAPAPIAYGAALNAVQLNAIASVPGTFTYLPPAGSVPISGMNTLSATFTPTDTVNYDTTRANVGLLVNSGRPGIEIPPPGMISTIAGNGIMGSIGDGGQATSAELNTPYGIAVDSAGDIYVADTENNVVREVNSATGVISTVAGNHTPGYSGDGGAAVNAELNAPFGVAVDLTGNLYIADSGNNAIRMVNTSTGIITTLVGDSTGKAGYLGDGGPATAAELNNPSGVAVDVAGNIYIADWMNNAIREVNASTGTISTAVGDGTGTAGYLGDTGSATNAELNKPFGVAIDNSSGNPNSGNIYIADSFNNRIRVVNSTTHVINTFAGNGTVGYLGDNGVATSAEVAYPLGIATDASGNLLIADWMNNAIREVSAFTGVITTVAGNGIAGYSGDGGQATNAALYGPAAVATDALVAFGTAQNAGSPAFGVGGNVFGGDTGSNAVRAVGNPTPTNAAFVVPKGQYLFWAFATEGSASGDASATATSGSFYGPGTITWSGFNTSSLPASAVIKGAYAVEAFTTNNLNGLTAAMTVNGGTFYSAQSYTISEGQSSSLGTSLPSSIGATMTGSGEGSFNVNSAAVAVTYTISPGSGGGGGSPCDPNDPTSRACNYPMNCDPSQYYLPGPNGYNCCPVTAANPLGNNTICCPVFMNVPNSGPNPGVDPVCPGSSSSGSNSPNQLYLVDPYLVANNLLVSSDAAIDGQGGAATGIVADGTSTAIAVYETTDGNHDVVFQVDNGATLAPWDPSFLTEAPAPPSTSGSSGGGTISCVTASTPCLTLTVPQAQLIPQNGEYYALALVTAGTPVTSTILLPTHVSILNSGAQPLTKSMKTYPVPVEFVHGLWGNKTSLQSTLAYLQNNTPLGSPDFTSAFLRPICYSTYLAYYATSDSLPGYGTGCERTSAQALTDDLSRLYTYLDANGTVGGRVDVVAHSMGGLVARNYSTLTPSYALAANGAGYTNVRNRLQGTFREIVTLDTPETGSEIADYLVNDLANLTENPAASTIPVLVWNQLCPAGPTVTLRDCMQENLQLPLAYEGHTLTEGAVASLIPSDTHLQNLPDPNLPNANWFAVASSYLDNGQKPTAILRDFLNTLLAATTPATETPWMLSTMLGTRNNDVIVALNSQIYHAIPGQFQVFNGLAHTPTRAIGPIAQQFGWASNNSVTKSQQVNQQVASWLGYPGDSPSPQSSGFDSNLDNAPSVGVGDRESDDMSQHPLFPANDRFTAAMPSHSVELAEPIQIELSVMSDNVVSITVEQSIAGHTLENERGGVPIGSGDAVIINDYGLKKVIEVTPLQVGTVDLSINLLFADGGVSRKVYQLNVRPSSRKLTQFQLNRGSQVVAIVLEDDEKDRELWLSPGVQYDGLDHPIFLVDSQQIAFTVEQSEYDPVVRLDSNGMLHGLSPGRAKIIGDFDGFKDVLFVDVYSKDSAPPGYRVVHDEKNP